MLPEYNSQYSQHSDYNSTFSLKLSNDINNKISPLASSPQKFNTVWNVGTNVLFSVIGFYLHIFQSKIFCFMKLKMMF